MAQWQHKGFGVTLAIPYQENSKGKKGEKYVKHSGGVVILKCNYLLIRFWGDYNHHFYQAICLCFLPDLTHCHDWDHLFTKSFWGRGEVDLNIQFPTHQAKEDCAKSPAVLMNLLWHCWESRSILRKRTGIFFLKRSPLTPHKIHTGAVWWIFKITG